MGTEQNRKKDELVFGTKRTGSNINGGTSWSWRSHYLKGCSSRGSHSYLVLPPQPHGHPHRRRCRRSNRWKRSGSRTSSSHNYLVLPSRTCGHPQCQQILMRATASGRLEGIIFWFLFLEVRAIASRMRAIGSQKALALVGPSASSGVGGTGRLVDTLPVRGEHVYAKRGDATIYRVSRSKGMYYFHVPQQ